jgi:hypothetical protein
MARSIGFDHVGGSATSFVWDLNDVAERVQDDQWVVVGPGTIDIIVVGGGGGGGSGNSGGGGGAGGSIVSSGVAVDVGKPYIITIGAGGGTDTNGGNTIFKDSAETLNFIAYGGGAGGSSPDGTPGTTRPGKPGGNGGGGGGPGGTAGSATTFPTGQQGTPGGDSGSPSLASGSGGGADEQGVPGTTASALDPTDGLRVINFLGNNGIVQVAGGGGGRSPASVGYGTPTNYGGGQGKRNDFDGNAGVNGKGGGGGKENVGGSGVFMLRYPQAKADPTFVSGAAEKLTQGPATTGWKSFTFTSGAVIQFS